MPNRARFPRYSFFILAFLLAPMVLTAGQDESQLPSSPPREIIVWKVGDPHLGDIPGTAIAPNLKEAAEKMGLKITVQAYSPVGFAQRFFDALNSGQEPDVLAIDNYGILVGITTSLGDFTGIASDETVGEQLVEVTESLTGLEDPNSFRKINGWEFLVASSRHAKAAKLLALRPPECDQRGELTPLTPALEESAVAVARAYLQDDRASLSGFEDPERLHTDAPRPRKLNLSETKGCGYWGDERLAFVPVVSTYKSARKVGQVSLLLILRKQDAQWKLLVASADPVSTSQFQERIPKLVSLLKGAQAPSQNPLPAKLLAPADGQFSGLPPGQRFGDFAWQPSRSSDVVAQIIEFAYRDDARLFLRFTSEDTLPNDHISDGLLWGTRILWRWRVWSISESGSITFSGARSFTN